MNTDTNSGNNTMSSINDLANIDTNNITVLVLVRKLPFRLL